MTKELLKLADQYDTQAIELAEAMIDSPAGAVTELEALLCPAWFQIADYLRARANMTDAVQEDGK